jgi:hypothetical protein
MSSGLGARLQWLLASMGLARATPPAGGPATREASARLVRWFLQTQGAEDTPGLNAQGFGGAMVGGAQLYFEHHADTQQLECGALIYRFREEPKPGVIEGFRKEAEEGSDTGGGVVDYEPESKSLFLTRTYAQLPSGTDFSRDMEALMKASLEWGHDVLDRVATRVFGH